jgi:manganese transport protein
MAIVPAVLVILHYGDQGTYKLLILSQVILSLQLPFAVVPLVKFTSSRRKMGGFVTPRMVAVIAWLVAAIIISLNAKLVYDQIGEWSQAAGDKRWLVLMLAVPIAVSLGGLLVWMIFRNEGDRPAVAVLPGVVAGAASRADTVADEAHGISRSVHRIGVALEAADSDAAMLSEAITAARTHRAELVLMHIVEGVGGQYHGSQADDDERRHDEQYMLDLTQRLQRDLKADGVSVRAVLGYGDVRREIIRIAQLEKLDLLVLGGHGHRGFSDLIRGTTIDGVRHNLRIPVLAVRAKPEA